MTGKYQYDDILEMLPAFALGALEPDEMLAVEEYLRTQGTSELMAHLEAYEDAAAMMALDVPAQPLPGYLKGQIFSAIEADIGVSAVAQAQRTPREPHATVVNDQPAENPVARWLGALFRPLAWAAVGAALALLLLQPSSRSAQGELAAARTELQRVQSELQDTRDQNLSLQQINQSLQSRLDASDRQLAVLASQTIPLAGQEAAPGASGALYVGQGESVLVLSGLNVLPESQTYQLWLIPADGAPVPSGLLALRQPDVDSLTVTLPDAPANYAAVGVSIEPAGGSTEPTGPIVLVGLTRS